MPGNSGGPLLDSNGNVCGMITSKINEINFAKHTRNTGSTISYAIKASYIKALVTSGGNPMKLLSNKDFPVKKNLDSIVLQVFAKN